MTMFLMIMLGALTLPACSDDGDRSSRGESSGRDESGSDDDGSSGGSSGSSGSDECYWAGYDDCDYGESYEPEYWDCSGSDETAYDDGWCDCISDWGDYDPYC